MPRFIYRFDDICPTMDWDKWDAIERVLDETGSCAIVGVVPDNQDRNLMVQPAHPRFWSRAREWQDKGYIIGLHGYRHLADTSGRSLIPIHTTGEFLSRDFDDQYSKISGGLEIFREEGLKADLWVAPWHAFNEVTLDVLKVHGITVISDGDGIRPTVDGNGFVWVPQQLGMPRRYPGFGTWTICLHPNNMSSASLEALFGHMRKYGRKSDRESFWSTVRSARRDTIVDQLVGMGLRMARHYKRSLRRR